MIKEIISSSAYIFKAQRESMQYKINLAAEKGIYNSRSHSIVAFGLISQLGSGQCSCSCCAWLPHSLSPSLSLALSLVRCVVALQSWLVIKIEIVINSSVRSTWRIIALSLAGVMENASWPCALILPLPLGYFSSYRLPRPLHQAATYYMTALRAALPDTLQCPLPAPFSPLSATWAAD